MNQQGKIGSQSFGKASVQVYATVDALGKAAAGEAAAIIRAAIARNGRARIIVATGNSQLALIAALTQEKEIDWKLVEVFHMDEYIGLSQIHPSSFRYWLRTRIENRVHPGKMNYLAGDSADIDGEIARYSALLLAAPIDLAFVGFGENGHIAFNDPPVADFDDPAIVKKVELDDMCRRQQAGEGHFADFDSVPKEAITVTCPGLFRAEAWICSVPEKRKAEAVRNALEGAISIACPASLVRTHPRASIYLDTESAGLLGVEELV
jgi:glucosamine-6-phosphate deaminase